MTIHPDTGHETGRVGGLVFLIVGVAITIALVFVVLQARDRDDEAVEALIPTTTTPGDGAPAPGDTRPGTDDPDAVAGDPTIEAARAAQCDLDRRTLDSAVAVFEGLEGRPPASVEEMTLAGTIEQAPAGWEIVDDGGTASVRPVPGGICDR